jgi:hypothetical protein
MFRASTRSALRNLAITVAWILACAVPAVAQDAQGRVTGRVGDGSGAALPGVTVTLVSPAITAPVVVVTDMVGQYTSPPLPAGTYTLVFELVGFETRAQTGIEVRPGNVLTVDARLAVAPVKETVEVVGQAPPPIEPPPHFDLPTRPEVIPVPPEVLASVCGPAQTEAFFLTVAHIVGHRDERNRTLFGNGDLLVLDAGESSGLAAGQNYVVRRRFRVADARERHRPEMSGEHTAGLVQVVQTTEAHALAAVVYACSEFYAGDTVEPFDPMPLWRTAPAGTPQYSEPARVVFGESGRSMGAPRQLMVIDRGSVHGTERGQRVTIFRRPQGGRGPVSQVADAVVIAVRADSATIRIERASDAVLVGDLVAMHR